MSFQLMKLLLLISLFTNVLTDAKLYKCAENVFCGCGSSNVEINASSGNVESIVPCSWSMIVSIRFDFSDDRNSPKHSCSGTILTDSYILTAASCLERMNGNMKSLDAKIPVGIYSKSNFSTITRYVDKTLLYKDWTGSRNDYHYDVAILHLSEPIDFQVNACISRTCLSTQLKSHVELIAHPKPYSELVVVGRTRTTLFNEINANTLIQTVALRLDSSDFECHQIITDSERAFCVKVNNNRSGICIDDLGSPIFQWMDDHWQQVGILSFTLGDCQQNSVIGYTRIAYYRDWIDEQIQVDNMQTNETLPMIALPPIDLTDTPETIYVCDKYAVPCGCSRQNVRFPQSNQAVKYEAVPYSWSMIVSIRLQDANKHLCSGSILSESFVLTSASCLSHAPVFGINIVAGIHNHSESHATHRKIDQIFLHPNYMGIVNDYAHDIAILHMSQPLDFNDDLFVSPICLPEKQESLQNSTRYPASGIRLALIGWGSMNCPNQTEQPLLQQIQIYSIDHSDKSCYVLDKHRTFQFCAGVNQGETVPCVADSGSPLFEWVGNRWQQVGIASHYLDCVPLRNSGIYTRIFTYNNWIQTITGNCTTPSTSSPEASTTVTTTVSRNSTVIQSSIEYQCNKTLTCGCGNMPVILKPARIVGGENAQESSWPMIVSIRWISEGNHLCGGTILSNSYILTAAHCFYGYVSNPPVGVTIAVGMTNISDTRQIRRTVDHVYFHPDYIGRQDNYRHDIAIMHLNQSLIFHSNKIITKTCIHRISPPVDHSQYIKNGTRLAVIGWGDTKNGNADRPQMLQQVEVYAVDSNHPTCMSSMNDSEVQFCAGLIQGGKDACQGDSGGPIFQWREQYWEQVGIVSNGRGCAKPGYRGVYTRLSYYYDWINSILAKDNENLEPAVESNKSSIESDGTTTRANILILRTRSYANNHRENTLIFVALIIYSLLL